MTDYLRFVEGQFGLHRHVMEPLERVLERSGAEGVVDLCSGAGGPLQPIAEQWKREGRSIPILLTDLYPHPEAAMGSFEYRADPVDATDPSGLPAGLRTLFSGFHHFRPAEAKKVLGAAVREGQPIAVFEVADRTIPAILPLVLVPIFVLLMTPFIRPFRWTRLLWTYLIPVLPVAILWDGVVSYLRAYTPEELSQMGRDVAPEYEWESGYVRAEKTPGRMTYLIGWAR